MEMAKIRMPNLNAAGLRTSDKMEMIMEYVLSLEKQMRYVLNNLEEDNLGTGLTGTLDAASKVANAGFDEQLTQKLNRGDIENSLLATKNGKVLDAYQGRVLNEQKLNKTDFASMVLQCVYPVGSIYVSVTDIDPGTVFGGEWERIKDTFLLAAGDSYAAGATGGEAEVSLTEKQMPKHSHTEVYPTSSVNVRPIGSGTMDKAYTDELATTSGTYKSLTTFPTHVSAGESNPIYPIHTMYSGNSQPHNNMPPYLAVYVWKRIA